MGPVLIVTGAAAAGKSTVCARLATVPGVLALDADTLAAGAAAVVDGRQDYPAFWRYLLDIAAEVHRNGLVTAYCGVCLPDQVLGGAGAVVHLLALVSDAQTVERRIRARHDDRSLANLAVHRRIDSVLRTARVPAPHSLTRLDTRGRTERETADEAERWVRSRTGGRPD